MVSYDVAVLSGCAGRYETEDAQHEEFANQWICNATSGMPV